MNAIYYQHTSAKLLSCISETNMQINHLGRFIYRRGTWQSLRTQGQFTLQLEGPLTCDKEIMWMAEKHEMVQIHFTLDLADTKEF